MDGAGRIYIYLSIKCVSMSGELIWMSIDFHVVGGLGFPVDCVDRDCHFHSMCSSRNVTQCIFRCGNLFDLTAITHTDSNICLSIDEGGPLELEHTSLRPPNQYMQRFFNVWLWYTSSHHQHISMEATQQQQWPPFVPQLYSVVFEYIFTQKCSRETLNENWIRIYTRPLHRLKSGAECLPEGENLSGMSHLDTRVTHTHKLCVLWHFKIWSPPMPISLQDESW